MAKSMVLLPHTKHQHIILPSQHTQLHNLHPHIISTINSTSNFIKFNTRSSILSPKSNRSITFRNEEQEEDDEDDDDWRNWSNKTASNRSSRMEKAVKLFNEREYYACHDVLESLWYDSDEPLRTLLHAILQCAVAFHHLFNQNHKGAMMEFGEGVCKLRKLNFESGPFHEFERQISAVLDFIYQTQLELAACNEDFCIAMEQTERSYQLLEGFGAGQHLYFLENENENKKEKEKGIDITVTFTYIVFDPRVYGGKGVPRTTVKLPTLEATSNHFVAYQNY